MSDSVYSIIRGLDILFNLIPIFVLSNIFFTVLGILIILKGGFSFLG
jgi:hypothetical protein